MNKIKTIKIKNEDGSVSEESYSITTDALNIDMSNGYNLQETIGNIDVETDGSIAEQLQLIINRLIALEEQEEEENNSI
jgi:uncharacterized protein YecA (UPF0149 family)